jgi:hypothetical protein
MRFQGFSASSSIGVRPCTPHSSSLKTLEIPMGEVVES